ncbi:putative prolactin receptor-like [Triplophysa rosa]|uniref:Prolactin receptor-like n=2 Tax=Triplophysa rosa TaxID=992332 RepID=A0A9W7WZN4_TRIRA|nr:putative prolactin receptor-like [Triplophysa rosa]
MLFVLLTLHWTTLITALHESSRTAGRQNDVVRPNISKCRSSNMEDFTCHWNPLDREENVTYTFLYTIEKDVFQECPDYVTAGPNSCHFDAKHTQVWQVYCMNVTAHTRSGPITSPLLCIDVVEIVETDPPFNLSYSMLNKSGDESGQTILVSWLYPCAPDVNTGWLTLVYDLRYRHLSEPDQWKVKERLRETHLELLDLPMGSYELMVRCRSDKSKLWSRWSDPIYFTVTTGRLLVHMLVIMLVTAIAVMTFLIIGFGLIPQGKRIKAYLLSPIPKPRIRGLDPMLIKKGKIDEINQHFSTFHSYKPPQYSMETWYQVSLDASPAAALNGLMSYFKQEDRAAPQHQPFLQTNQSGPTEHDASYCRTPAEVDKPHQNTAEAWPEPSHTHPELVSFPGMDYSMILNPAPAESAVTQPSPLDFYTCVGEMTLCGAVHLVPCLPESMKSTAYLQFKDGAAEPDKSIQLAAFVERKIDEMFGADDTGETTDQRECDVPLLPNSDDKH